MQVPSNDLQRTPEWYAARVGFATASRAKDVFAEIKSGEAAARRDYRFQLAFERILGIPVEAEVSNKHISRGIELEPEALDAFMDKTGLIPVSRPFIHHRTIEWMGCSPDGDLGDEGVEIKCPKSSRQIEYILNGPPRDYVLQFHHQASVMRWGAVWFVSYCPWLDDERTLRMPKELALHIQRVPVDPKLLARVEEKTVEFLDEVAGTVKQIQKLIEEKKRG